MIVRTLTALALVSLLLFPGDLRAAEPPTAAAQQQAEKVDLNTATPVVLQTLPGVGARTAELIVEYREKNGRFEKIEDLMNVRGIGEKSFLRLRELVVVTPPKTERASS